MSTYNTQSACPSNVIYLPNNARRLEALLTRKSERIRGLRLLAIWTAGIVLPWALIFALVYGASTLLP